MVLCLLLGHLGFTQINLPDEYFRLFDFSASLLDNSILPFFQSSGNSPGPLSNCSFYFGKEMHLSFFFFLILILSPVI